MAQFAEPLFGETNFAFSLFVANCNETITSTDTIAKSVSLTLQDSQNSVDAVSDGVSLAALMDVIPLGNAGIGVLFGDWLFGEITWEKADIGGNLLLMANKVMTEGIVFTDAIGPFTANKALFDALMSTDAINFATDHELLDFLFMSDLARVEISNKALSDEIRMNDWLTIKVLPSEPWGD